MPTALIVEDEPPANFLLAQLLQLRHYQTDCVFNGGDALSHLREKRPDVIFLDLMLPDTNGYEVCRAIKSDPSTCLVPVVIVTARLADENRQRCYQAGAQVFVPKPYAPNQIFDALRAAEEWWSDLGSQGGEGVMALGRDAQFFRHLSRLRSLILARTPLPEAEVNQIAKAVHDIAEDAVLWGSQRGLSEVGLCRYALEGDRLVVEITDQAGWFAGGDLSEAAAGFDPSLDAVFDHIERMGAGPALRLIKHFPATPSASPSNDS
jgi:CheY-like chemotaxis protein